MNALRIALCSLVLLIVTSPLMAQGTYTQIDVPGAPSTICAGINTSGEIVGRYDSTLRGLSSFLLSGGNYTTIAYPGALTTSAYGLNDMGQIVGSYLGAGEAPGFLYDRTTQTFSTINYPNIEGIAAVSINNAGTIAGFISFITGNVYGLARSAAGTLKKINVPGSSFTYATGISDSGMVVGYYVSHNRFLNFSYFRGQYQTLQIPALDAEVWGTNPSGTAFVGYYNLSGKITGFSYQNQTLQSLTFPGALATYAYGVNDAGAVVGEFLDSSGLAVHGFLWTPPADAPKP